MTSQPLCLKGRRRRRQQQLPQLAAATLQLSGFALYAQSIRTSLRLLTDLKIDHSGDGDAVLENKFRHNKGGQKILLETPRRYYFLFVTGIIMRS